MEKLEMRNITTTQPIRLFAPRYRPFLTAFLVILCIPVFFYHLVPRFTSATDDIISKLADNVLQTSRGDSCTKEIGDRYCCMLYIDTWPCVDECRKEHVDRETLRLTLEYDQCADQCLGVYHDTCGKAGLSRT